MTVAPKVTKRPPAPLESAILRSIVVGLRWQRDVLFFRNNTGMLRDRKDTPVRYGLGVGSPDLIGILAPQGRLVCFEVKRPGNKPTPEQLGWHVEARRLGAFVAVVHSLPEALEALARARKGLFE